MNVGAGPVVGVTLHLWVALAPSEVFAVTVKLFTIPVCGAVGVQVRVPPEIAPGPLVKVNETVPPDGSVAARL